MTAGAAPLEEEHTSQSSLIQLSSQLTGSQVEPLFPVGFILNFLGEKGEEREIVTPIETVEKYTWGFENQNMQL